MKRNILISALVAAIAAVPSFAQNINPKVEVTSTWQGKSMEAHKPFQTMAVPDSLMRFDLNFDYSVFENPYKGAGDFNPYLMDMRPEATPDANRHFYLRAGAGYPLHPDVDFVWTPTFKKKAMQMNIYGSHHSYIGKYRSLYPSFTSGSNSDLQLLTKGQKGAGESPYGSDNYSGWQMNTRVGLNGSYTMSKSILSFDAAYSGIHAKDTIATSSTNAADISLRLTSNDDRDSYFYYDAGIDYLIGKFAENYTDSTFSSTFQDFTFKGTFGPVMNPRTSFLVDVNAGYSAFTTSYQVMSIFATPRYVHNAGRWRLSLGVKVGGVFNSDETFRGYELNSTKGQFVYPDVHIGFNASVDHLQMYLSATGGEQVNSYSSLKTIDPFFTSMNAYQFATMMDNSIERVNARFGLAGNFATKFRYDLSAGYTMFTNGLLPALTRISVNPYLPCMRYADYNQFDAALKYAYENGPISIDGNLKYCLTDLDEEDFVVAPAAFTADIRARYNWKKRIYAGIYADYSSSRDAIAQVVYVTSPVNSAEPVINETVAMSIPSFINVGLNAEYMLTRKFSVWAQADNLLNSSIQRIPGYCAPGINFRLGICVNL